MNEVDPNFVDDGTGLHPTATTYATTTVAVSHVYGAAQATPTVDTYHVSGIPPSDILAFNKRIGLASNGFLTFRAYPGEDPIWGNYSPWTDYRNIVYSPNYAPNKPMWLDGMTLRDSWDYHSPITDQRYQVIAPTVVFIDVPTKRAAYYFFDVIFNDFQASHGYANWDYSKDGWPSPYWPGVIQVVRSVIKSSQVPSNRDSYEVYMTSEYGTPLAVAPFVRSKDDMSTAQAFPTRYRNASPTSIVSKDVPPENLAIDLDTTGESTGSNSVIDQAAVNAQIQAAVSAALASAAITQQQAVAVQKASDDADKAQSIAAQQQLDTAQSNAAVASAITAGTLSQQQAVAAQAAADASAQSSALAAQAASDAATMSQAVATAVAKQAATDATQQAAAVAAQKAADASAQASAVAAQASADATAQATAVANAIAAQSSTDATAKAAALAQLSAADATALNNAVAAQAKTDGAWLAKAPKFTSGTVTIGANYTGVGFASNSSLSGMDYSHTWLVALAGYGNNGSTGNGGPFTTLAAAQAASPGVLLYDGSNFYTYTAIQLFNIISTRNIYSGWLRSGTVYQQVGWVINTGTASSPVRTLVTTGYGYTSLAPVVNNGATPSTSTTYTLTTASTQTEILGQMNVSTSTSTAPAVIGFIYDGSVGTYGQVTWISQI